MLISDKQSRVRGFRLGNQGCEWWSVVSVAEVAAGRMVVLGVARLPVWHSRNEEQ